MNTANKIIDMMEDLLLVDLEECLLDSSMCRDDLKYIKQQQLFESSTGIDAEVLSKENKGEYEIRKELWTHYSSEPTEMTSAYSTYDDSYIGQADNFVVKWIKKYGLTKVQKAKKDHSVASIAFCQNFKKDKKDKGKEVWIGWSHRASCPFGIGDQLFKQSDFKNHKDPGDVPFVKVGSERIKTLDQTKMAAINFAGYVS